MEALDDLLYVQGKCWLQVKAQAACHEHPDKQEIRPEAPLLFPCSSILACL